MKIGVAILVVVCIAIAFEFEFVESQTTQKCFSLLSDRKLCISPTASRQECETNGCCYNENVPDNIPKCYYKNGEAPSYGAWQSWGRCSRTCGKGEEARERFCVTKDGKPTLAQSCGSDNREVKSCNLGKCPPAKRACVERYSSVCQLKIDECTTKFMKNNCPITCGLCKGPPQVCKDDVGTDVCKRLLTYGKCESPLYGAKLNTFCQLTCGVCKDNTTSPAIAATVKPTEAEEAEIAATTKPATVTLPNLKYPLDSCEDEFKTCSRIEELCTEPKRYNEMYLYCRKSCKMCADPIPDIYTTTTPATTTTTTKAEVCQDILPQNDCKTLDCSVPRVQEFCKETCGLCCQDSRDYCQEFKSLCTDKSFANVMSNCKVTCGMCGRRPIQSYPRFATTRLVLTTIPTTTTTIPTTTPTTTTIPTTTTTVPTTTTTPPTTTIPQTTTRITNSGLDGVIPLPSGCEDTISNCEVILQHCNSERYEHITKYCKKSCGSCGEQNIPEMKVVPYNVNLNPISNGDMEVTWQVPRSSKTPTEYVVTIINQSTKQRTEYTTRIYNKNYRFLVTSFTHGDMYTAVVAAVMKETRMKPSLPSLPYNSAPPIPLNVQLTKSPLRETSTLQVSWQMPMNNGFVVTRFEITLLTPMGEKILKVDFTSEVKAQYFYTARGLRPGKAYQATIVAVSPRGVRSSSSVPSNPQRTVCRDTFKDCDILIKQCNETDNSYVIRDTCALTCNLCSRNVGPIISFPTIASSTTTTKTTIPTTTTTIPTTTTTDPPTTTQAPTTLTLPPPTTTTTTEPSTFTLTTPPPTTIVLPTQTTKDPTTNCKDTSRLCSAFRGSALCKGTSRNAIQLQISCASVCGTCHIRDELQAQIPTTTTTTTIATTTVPYTGETTTEACKDKFVSTCEDIKARNLCNFGVLRNSCRKICGACT